MKSLNYQVNHSLYQIFKTISSISSKIVTQLLIMIYVMVYVSKIEHRNPFKIKAEYYVELLTPGTMKLLGSTKNKITKVKKMMKGFLI